MVHWVLMNGILQDGVQELIFTKAQKLINDPLSLSLLCRIIKILYMFNRDGGESRGVGIEEGTHGLYVYYMLSIFKSICPTFVLYSWYDYNYKLLNPSHDETL